MLVHEQTLTPNGQSRRVMSEQLAKLLGLRVIEVSDTESEKFGGKYAYPLNDTGSKVVGFQSPDEALEHWLASITNQHVAGRIKSMAEQLTAAQQRVAELERENAELKRSLTWYKMRPFMAVTSTSGVGEPIFKHPLADEPHQRAATKD